MLLIYIVAIRLDSIANQIDNGQTSYKTKTYIR